MTQVHANGHVNAPGGVTSTQWLGDSGQSGNGDWNTGADWNGNTVPGASGSVTFATGNFGYTVTGDATIGAITVDGDGVTFDGAVTQDTGSTAAFLTALDGASVTLDTNALFQGGAIAFQDGSFLDVQGTLITTGGTADAVAVDAEGAQLIAASAITLNQLYVQNGGSYAGDLNLNDGGNVTLDTASSFGGGTLTLGGNGLIFAGDGPSGGGYIGIGEDIVTAGVGAALQLGSSSDVTLGVSGVISGDSNLYITSGNVELAAGNTYTGGTTVQDANLQVDGAGAAGTGVIFLGDGGFTAAGTAGYSDTVVANGTDDKVNAGVANLLVFGSQSGTLDFIGGSADSTVVGGSGVLDASGGSAGADNVYGGASPNIVPGDLIFGGTSGQDVLQGGSGATTLAGGIGGTLIAQGSAHQVLAAGGGTSFLLGSTAGGNDTLFGGGAGTHDYITGGTGVDTVVLNAGTADIYSGTGTLDIFGGSGSFNLDFVAGYPGGVEKVVGFNLSTDKIVLTGYANGTAASVLADAQLVGGSTVLNLSNGSEIVLFGVTGLTASNFG